MMFVDDVCFVHNIRPAFFISLIARLLIRSSVPINCSSGCWILHYFAAIDKYVMWVPRITVK